MTEQVLENAAEELEPTAPSVQEVSEPKAGQPTSKPSGMTEDRLLELLAERDAKLLSKFEEEVGTKVAERAAQSWKDRRLGKFETTLEEVLDMKTQIEKDGGNWDNVIADFQARQREDELFARLSQRIEEATISRKPSETDVKKAWAEEWATETQKIRDKAKAAGVEITDAEMVEINKMNFATTGDAYSYITELAVKKAKGENVDLSLLVAPGGGSPPPVVKEEPTSEDEYDKAKKAGAKQEELQAILDKQWAALG